MLDSQMFCQIIHNVFEPFLNKMGIPLIELTVNGRFYIAEFNILSSHTLSITYEPGDWYMDIGICGTRTGDLSIIDDPIKSPSLSDLNARFYGSFTKDEIIQNTIYFQKFKGDNEDEKKLIKAAQDLRLILPKYLKEIKNEKK